LQIDAEGMQIDDNVRQYGFLQPLCLILFSIPEHSGNQIKLRMLDTWILFQISSF